MKTILYQPFFLSLFLLSVRINIIVFKYIKMIEFHYLIYILFLTATSSKQISVGVILPFYDGLWGYYGDQFLLYNKNQTKKENFSIEVYYCNKSASIQQAYAAEFISRKFDVIVVSSQDSKALKNIVEYAKILQSKVVTFIRRMKI